MGRPRRGLAGGAGVADPAGGDAHRHGRRCEEAKGGRRRPPREEVRRPPRSLARTSRRAPAVARARGKGEGREGNGTTMRGGAGWRSSPRDTCTAVDAGAGVVAGGERELKETRRM